MSSKVILKVLLLLLFLYLYGCASANKEPQLNAEPIQEREPLEGIWKGEFDIGEKGPYDYTIVQVDGNAFGYSLRAKAMCIGTVRLTDDNYFSKCILFALDGGPFDWATIAGKLKSPTELATHFSTLNGGDTGALNLSYSAVYEQVLSIDNAIGEWSYTDRDDLTTELSLQEGGTLIGKDSDSCEFLGYLDTINPSYNAYKVKLEITQCASVNGQFEGVAFFESDHMNIQIANEKYALFYAFKRN